MTRKETKKILQAYLNGASMRKAATTCGRSQIACSTILEKQGITPREYTGKRGRRTYAVDETFFDRIDTEAKAYWLGFLTADGYPKNPNSIGCTLKRSDEAHLRKFRDSLKSNHPIKRGMSKTKDKKYPNSYIAIGSKHLLSVLSKLGALDQPANFCTCVPVDLQHHYWRGCVDGDGWVLSSVPPRYRSSVWNTGLCGSRVIVQGYANFIYERLGHSKKIDPAGTIFQVRYNGLALPRDIVTLIYAGAHVFLNRKKKQADILMQIEDRPFNYPSYDGKYLQALYSKHKTWTAVAGFLVAPRSTISGIALKWRQKNT